MSQTTLKSSSSMQMVAPEFDGLGPLEQLALQNEIKNLIAWVNSNYQASKSDRMRFERQWALNMSFYRGRQYMQYLPTNAKSPLAGKLFTPPSPSWASRTVTNRIRPIIRTEMARLCSNKPNASVVPASNEDFDLFAAQAGEQVWESLYNYKKLHRIFTSTAFWLTICGSSFMKVWWDPNEYDCVSKANGSIEYGAVTPYHIFVSDLYEEDIEKQPWVINAYTKPVAWVKSVYGVDVNPNVTSAKSPFDQAMLESSMGVNEAKPDSVLVLECWIKPNVHARFPEGGMITIAGDTEVLAYSPTWPYLHKQYPFVKFDHIPTGMFYAESVITDLIPLQREYNKTRNQTIDSKNRMSKPQLVAPLGSVDPKKITSEPGLVIEYKPGLNAPSPLPLQSIPPYVLQEQDRTIADMEDISSQHQVSRGQAPPGVTAATAISFMQERDDSLMTTVYQSVEDGWEKIAKQSLSHVVQFWDSERTISVTGVDGSFDSLVLQGSELENGTDIRMEAGSALPISKAAKQAFLLDLMKMGLIDPNKGLELMEMGGIDKLYDEIKIDERQAQRENVRLSRTSIEEIENYEQKVATQNQTMQQLADEGMTPPPEAMNGPVDPTTGDMLMMPPNLLPVNTWDNHQLHIEVHNRFRKSQGFERLSEKHKQQFELHVQMHAFALNQAAMSASMLPPPPDAGESMGADNGSGTPLGTNQFGPPGVEDGAPPPEMLAEGMQ